jgi:hypothetical protein
MILYHFNRRIDGKLMDIMRYLMTRPYGEVVKLMNSLAGLTPVSGGNTDVRKK